MAPPQPAENHTQREIRMAALSAITAYIAWGLFGLYFKSLDHVSALEILSHRILWSVGLLAIIITALKKWSDVIPLLINLKSLSVYGLSALLISVNWGIYIYAVVSGQALEGSMGYFIMPLVAVMLGGIFFGERFTKEQTIAILLAVAGVLYQIINFGQLPWIALSLAFSFGFYGMIRKKAAADSIVGLFLETLLISPIALGFMIYWAQSGDFYFLTAEIDMKILLMLAGPITAIPLILFAFGARKLRYSTVGLLQYINPTCQFLLAVYVFGEDFSVHDLVTFGCIWTALLLYSQNSYRQSRRNKAANS
ncbi:EamA family transporter RarD [Terasakiella sp. A23]|uniref:EamA family transporter RarD n=1 Tax=Terasakiella sp. FCG-A23 TaxID=3080561 RepID=UPI0029551589|nr:EamA family transporter RarD [Terasakiella sp. A23]MDV7339463.1 EamA family transporter RarD [Terasakiella sp. A23]